MVFIFFICFAAAGCDESKSTTTPYTDRGVPTFFVSSATSVTGNLGGLTGADATCQRLAAAVGQGSRTWRAYLSVERDASNNHQATHARDRIGTGPWRNASNVVVANNLTELHARVGDAAVFIDEKGRTRIRIARTPRRATEPGASTASRGRTQN